MPKRTVPNSENMNDNANGIKQKNDPIQKNVCAPSVRKIHCYLALGRKNEPNTGTLAVEMDKKAERKKHYITARKIPPGEQNILFRFFNCKTKPGGG